jgi:hypothetical protein
VAKIRAVWATRPWAPLARAELQERVEMDAPAFRHLSAGLRPWRPDPVEECSLDELREAVERQRRNMDYMFFAGRRLGRGGDLGRALRDCGVDVPATEPEPPALADEIEAWTEVLYYLRHGAVFGEGGYFSLCGLLQDMRQWQENLIDDATYLAMRGRITRALRPGEEYLAPPGDARARIPIVQRFLRDAIAERAAAEPAP